MMRMWLITFGYKGDNINNIAEEVVWWDVINNIWLQEW